MQTHRREMLSLGELCSSPSCGTHTDEPNTFGVYPERIGTTTSLTDAWGHFSGRLLMGFHSRAGLVHGKGNI